MSPREHILNHAFLPTKITFSSNQDALKVGLKKAEDRILVPQSRLPKMPSRVSVTIDMDDLMTNDQDIQVLYDIQHDMQYDQRKFRGRNFRVTDF